MYLLTEGQQIPLPTAAPTGCTPEFVSCRHKTFIDTNPKKMKLGFYCNDKTTGLSAASLSSCTEWSSGGGGFYQSTELCGASPAQDAAPRLSFSEASEACSSHGLQLCDASELCPDGQRLAKFLGKKSQSWAPDRNAAQQWVFLGDSGEYSIQTNRRPAMRDAPAEAHSCGSSRSAAECIEAAKREVCQSLQLL